MLASSDASKRVALQPEDRREELVLFRLFSATGVRGCRFTLDIGEYPGLDEDLARRAADDGPFAPGTRALVIPAPHVAPEYDETSKGVHR